MPEVKTCRCDICKEIYYSDKTDTEVILAFKSHMKDEDKDVTLTYDNICPECAQKLVEFTNNPHKIEQLKLERSDARDSYNKLGSLIHTLRDHLLGWSSNSWPSVAKYSEMLDDVLYEHKRVCKHRDIWRNAAVVVSVAYLIVMFLTIINQV